MAVFLAMLVSCSSVFTQPTVTWDKLTKDEQARVIVSGIQYGSPVLFTVGKGFMVAQPQYSPAWKAAIVPSFDVINKTLLDIEIKGAAGQPIDGLAVLQSLQGRVAEIVALVSQYGVISAGTGGKMTADNYGLLAMLGISTGMTVWNDVVAVTSGNIPSWEMIKARNQVFQGIIDAEK
jgi:hypothetical protein